MHNGNVREGPGPTMRAQEYGARKSADRAKMDAIFREMEQQPGIFCIHAGCGRRTGSPATTCYRRG